MALPDQLGDREVQKFVATTSDATAVRTLSFNTLIPDAYDYIALTYVAAGSGAGEIETVTYKTGGAAGTTVGTLTLTYDASDRLATITKA